MGTPGAARLLAAALAFCPGPVWSCSCAFQSTQGFIRAGRGPEAGPQRLPADAKGVLFLQPFRGELLGSSRSGAVLAATPPPLRAETFAITDETGKASVAPALKRLALPGEEGYARYFLMRSPSKERCLRKPSGEECRLFQRFQMEHEDWLEQLLARGELRDVTSDVERSFGLFRVGPADGFKPGRDYAISARGAVQQGREPMYAQTLRVHVDAAAAGPALARGFTLSPDGEQSATLLPVASGGSCSVSITARVQRLRYGWAAQLKPYESSLLFFTTRRDEGGAERAWSYRSNVCAQEQLGRSEVGFARDLVFADCKDQGYGQGLKRGISYAVQGYAGLLEVEDAPRRANELAIALSPGACDAKTIVDQAAAAGDVEQLCRLASSPESDPAAFERLLPALARWALSADAKARRCAIGALQPAPYRFQNGGLDDAARERIVDLALGALRDPDVETRRAAAATARDFARVLKLPASRAPAAVAALAAALKDDDQSVRVAVAEALGTLGPDARLAAPALVAAVGDQERPNYAAPRALLAVAPAAPQTAPALRAALSHKDSIVRGEAAAALGQLGAAGASSLSELLAAAKTDNADAVTALGQLGPAAKEAVPFLLEMAKSSKWDHLRQRAMESLAAIAPAEPAVLEAIVSNLRQPAGQFTRQKALETLGKLRENARPAVPEMLGVLDREPTDYEAATLLSALQRIQPPAEQVRTALMRLLDSKATHVREQAAKGLVRVSADDGRALAKILGDDDASVVHVGLQALAGADPGRLRERALATQALARVIADDSRYSDTRRYAYAAARSVAVGDARVCAALARRLEKEAPVNRSYVAQVRREVCP